MPEIKKNLRIIGGVVLIVALAAFGGAAQEPNPSPTGAAAAERQRAADNLYARAGELFKAGDRQEAARLLTAEVLPLAREIGDPKFETKVLERIAGIFYGLGNYARAIEFFAIELENRRRQKDAAGEARMWSVIGSNYEKLGDKSKAIESYDRAAALYRAADNSDKLAETLFFIGAVYNELKEREKATAAFLEALPLFEARNDWRLEETARRFLGIIYSETGEPLKGAAQFERILVIQRAAGGRRPAELKTLRTISIMYRLAGEFEKSVGFSVEAAALARELVDAPAEAENLLNAGRSYRSSKQPEKALEYSARADAIFKTLGDRAGQGRVLFLHALLASDAGETAQSLEFYNRAMPFFDHAKDAKLRAALLEEIAVAHTRIFELARAVEAETQALEIYRELKNEDKQAKILYELGLLNANLNRRAEAIENYAAALRIYVRFGNQKRVAEIHENIGSLYADLNETARAVEFYEKSLKLSREIKDADAEVMTLNSLGAMYYQTGAVEKAFEYFNLALPLLEKIKNRKNVASALNNVGVIYEAGGEAADALNFYSKSLASSEASGDYGSQATTLNNLGTLLIKKNLLDEGIAYLKKALPLFRLENDFKNEAVALANLRAAHEKLGSVNLSVAYGKLAVARYQQIRRGDNALDSALQKTYLQSVEPTYRNLTTTLLDAGRLGEAQQVLNAFKDQQAFDFSPAAREKIQPLALTARETKFVREYETETAKLNRLRGQAADLRRRIGTREPTAAEKTELAALDKNLAAGEDRFVKSLPVENELARLKVETEKLEIADTQELQRTLRELDRETGQKTAAVYTFAGAEKFTALVVADDSMFVVSTAVKREKLDETAREFWSALQNPTFDPRPSGRELYRVVFEPLAAKLPDGTTTILWSLDGALRYVPMSALHDGEKYLAEKYRHVVFTRADRERLTRAARPNWTATGFGSTAAHTVDNGGEKISFNALPAVRDELDAIFKTGSAAPGNGIFDGAMFADGKFSKPQMLEALKAKRPLVHIASHFAFRPGDDARSFLLMGDGTAFTLAEMKREKLLFDGVELLTLSACNTAAVRPDADGREIDGFAELAQRLGANSVLASLWAVADESTAILMSEFYKTRKENQNWTKAETLRRAQLELLYGTYTPEQAGEKNRSEAVRFGGNAKAMPKFTKDEKAPFAHPFYWSPFVLIGNWR